MTSTNPSLLLISSLLLVPTTAQVPFVLPVRDCTEEAKCAQCEGHCISDRECGDGLFCSSKEEPGDPIPLCIGIDVSMTDWCVELTDGVDTRPFVNLAPVRVCSVTDPCFRCEGNCLSDDECAPGLVCSDKGAAGALIPGCRGIDMSLTEWCILPGSTLYTTESPMPSFTPSMSPSGSQSPSGTESSVPTMTETDMPTPGPTANPTSAPTPAPSKEPTSRPTQAQPTNQQIATANEKNNNDDDFYEEGLPIYGRILILLALIGVVVGIALYIRHNRLKEEREKEAAAAVEGKKMLDDDDDEGLNGDATEEMGIKNDTTDEDIDVEQPGETDDVNGVAAVNAIADSGADDEKFVDEEEDVSSMHPAMNFEGLDRDDSTLPDIE